MPEHAKALACYDHPFFGKWPAITENEFGAGNSALRRNLSLRQAANRCPARTLEKSGLTSPDQQLPSAVHVQHGVNRLGKRLHYYFNYSGAEVKFSYPFAAGTNLLDGGAIPKLAR